MSRSNSAMIANTWMMIFDVLIWVLMLLEQTRRATLYRSKNSSSFIKSEAFRLSTTPTGFTAQRISTGSGRNKNAISFLVPIPEEKQLQIRSLSADSIQLVTSHGSNLSPLVSALKTDNRTFEQE